MKRAIPIFVALFLAACTKEVVQQKAHTVKEKVKNAVEDISTPLGKPDDAAARERERFDQRWRQLQSFRAQQAAIRKQQEQAAAAAKPPAMNPPSLRRASAWASAQAPMGVKTLPSEPKLGSSVPSGR